MNYYNEFDPHAAQWLRNLVADGLIPPGDVDNRSIEDVRPCEIGGYTQCHFFAGIGGWSLALQLAGWPADRPVWTGSCPCQPFSTAGKGTGFDDERHLWPSFQWLIKQCKPAVVFGEQVASSAVGSWVDLVQTDLEAMGYAFGCVAFPAAGVGAPHIRDRMFWVGDTDYARLEGHTGNDCATGRQRQAGSAAASGVLDRMANANRRDAAEPSRERAGAGDTQGGRAPSRHFQRSSLPDPRPAGPTAGAWRSADWLFCRDGKWRAVEPGTFPLADGVPARVVRLRAYGNAIVPQAAAEFVKAWMECRP